MKLYNNQQIVLNKTFHSKTTIHFFDVYKIRLDLN